MPLPTGEHRCGLHFLFRGIRKPRSRRQMAVRREPCSLICFPDGWCGVVDRFFRRGFARLRGAFTNLRSTALLSLDDSSAPRFQALPWDLGRRTRRNIWLGTSYLRLFLLAGARRRGLGACRGSALGRADQDRLAGRIRPHTEVGTISWLPQCLLMPRRPGVCGGPGGGGSL